MIIVFNIIIELMLFIIPICKIFLHFCRDVLGPFVNNLGVRMRWFHTAINVNKWSKDVSHKYKLYALVLRWWKTYVFASFIYIDRCTALHHCCKHWCVQQFNAVNAGQGTKWMTCSLTTHSKPQWFAIWQLLTTYSNFHLLHNPICFMLSFLSVIFHHRAWDQCIGSLKT